jgi:hypothetical protein
MANEKFSQLPTVTNANLADIIAAVQAGTSVQETLGQVFTLFLANMVLNNAGNPNGSVAGVIYQMCWDTTNHILYVCTTSGNAATAVWMAASDITIPVSLAQGGTGAALTAAAGGVVYSGASAMAISAVGSSGQIFQSTGTTAPGWTTATYPTTTTINQLLYSSGTNTVTGLATGNGGVLVTSNTGVPSILAGSGTTGTFLSATASGTPAWSTAAYPLTTTINQLLYSSSANVVAGLATANNGVLITGAGGIPAISSTLPAAVQGNITALGTLGQTLNMGTHTIINVVDPTNPQDAATKNYVDNNSLSGTSVYAASAATLGTVTQVGAGVGATLTNAGTQATFALDGVNPPVGSSVLIKNTATGMTAANEGIYVVTNAGSGATNWVLTRDTDYDTPTEINDTGVIVVQNGNTLAGTGWYNTNTIVAVDVTSFNFLKFGNGGTVTSITAGTGLTGGTITSTGTIALSYPVSAGGAVMKSLVYAYLNGTASGVTGDGTDYPIVMTASTDRNSDFASGIFTAPVTGIYLVTLGMDLGNLANDNTTLQVYLARTGSTTNGYYLTQLTTLHGIQASGEYVFTTTVAVNCTAGDTLQPHLVVAGHATKNINLTTGAANAGSTTMGIYLLG